ncbi:NAD(P)-binding protein [Dissoconium aciculare CBS 342.82]|uniref:NAD(P)-binding protein n=1 Tax=Dissoconium aciculare CBS 342.82 TaxID=1314786 RepID=A0A6J3LU43_9PEZI|nr:NAD(P)-binding protein [Dissoconium aciculare CBS 342.82]KAF1819305.1 NAD(P)-binding protein [Dissoconium aciculare CBS 342.82]
MTDVAPTVVFITGVGRGIGKGLLETYLRRDNHLVIGSVRDATSLQYDALRSLPTGSSSRLLLVSLESTSSNSAQEAVQEAQRQTGITHIDHVIANSAVAPPPSAIADVDEAEMAAAYDVNVLGPLRLYKATRELLDKAKRPIWTTISSTAGSVTKVQEFGIVALLSYGASKAAVNWLTVAIHTTHSTWIAAAIQPGFVSTDMGRKSRAIMGFPPPPMSVDDSASKIVSYMDNATRESASGILFDVMHETKVPF